MDCAHTHPWPQPMRQFSLRPVQSALLAMCLAAVCGPGLAETSDAGNQLAHSLLRELIEINTTESVGRVTAAAEAMAVRLRDAGYPASDIQVSGPNDRKKNLVVRLHGTGKLKPVLLIGHLDVVEANRNDWTTDPFKLVEKDGYFYGRGVVDMKGGDAILMATMIRFRKEGFRPDRDIILALTADEEGGDSNGVSWLLQNHRELIDAEFVLNHDGASIDAEHGVAQYYLLDATEKVYADYQLIVTNPGGHSSLPKPDNSIYELAEALLRLGHYEFPFELNAVTRSYYESIAPLRPPARAAQIRAILQTPPDAAAVVQLSKDPLDHATLHTTCVATRLNGGDANNALPQRAEATVNCRILPGRPPEEVRQDIIRVLNDSRVAVRYIADNGEILDSAPAKAARAPAPLNPAMIKPLRRLVQKYWPGLAIVPSMAVGASDGVFTSAAVFRPTR